MLGFFVLANYASNRTQSVRAGIPTRSVGTINCLLAQRFTATTNAFPDVPFHGTSRW